MNYPETVSPKMAPLFLASKWVHFDFLVETDELKKLFVHLSEPFYLFSTMGVQPKGTSLIALETFFDAWQRYIEALRARNQIVDNDWRFFFTACMTCDLGAIRRVEIPGMREIIIPYEPLMQMQIHRFSYSRSDNKIHPQAYGMDTVSWGVRLSYPQIFQYPHTRKVEDAQDEAIFKNAHFVPKVRAWLREVSVPTPLLIDGVRHNVPMRLGKGCFSWIANHFDLVRKEIGVHNFNFNR